VALVTARRALIRAIVGALCVTAAVAIVVLLTGGIGDTEWRILATTSAISFFGLLAVPVGTLLEGGRATTLARGSGGLTLLTFLATLAFIWSRHWSAGLAKTWGVLLTLAIAAAQAAAVEARRRDNDTPTVSALAAGSMLTGGVLAALGVIAILAEIDTSGYYRLLGAVAVLDVLVIAVAAVLRRSTGPIRQTHALRVDGQLVEIAARDFATAAALAIRQAERDGTHVKRVERA
jgi:hypothetical protein